MSEPAIQDGFLQLWALGQNQKYCAAQEETVPHGGKNCAKTRTVNEGTKQQLMEI